MATLVAEKSRTDRLGWAWRVLVCILLFLSGLTTSTFQVEQEGSLAQLYEDVRSGRAEEVVYRFEEDQDGYDLAVHWSTSPFTWYEHLEGGSSGPVPPQLLEAFPEDFSGPQGHTFPEDLAIANSVGHVRVERTDGYDRTRAENTFWVSSLSGWWKVPILLIAVALFTVMLRTRDHRYANRWAWFWLFLCTPAGMIGYLLLERSPGIEAAAPRATPPMKGYRGFVLGAILFPLLFAALGFGVGRLPL
ncbi:hypothetical protein GCM10022221_19300 [Actinocorallia aurea]